ncbi:uncharacterized protein LOC128390131 [Panonychus citri]|uniref:uncharacterized protein LOC128390131 n=1 Tax=Panonychus citri TaxID=50023 RepID=UPI002306F9EC|nr:uncharacterized protein LOC128390131 [Panonychus citri]XP_053205784.1 uncharacterized protein LOC128390131 [Panonychus citri]
MADKSSDVKTPDSPGIVDKPSEYSESSGKSPLEWLEINEGVHYSHLERISGERRLLNNLIANPVISFGLLGGAIAIGGGLHAIRSENPRLSNHFLKLRWGSSSLVFGFIVYKIWDQIDWNPPAVQKLQRYIAYAFQKDISLLTENEADKITKTTDKVKQ